MRVLDVVGRVDSKTILAADKVGREYRLNTSISVKVGESVVLQNGVVVAKTRTTPATVYEV